MKNTQLYNMFSNYKIIHKEARLLIDIKLDNGEKRKKGDIVLVFLDKGNDEYNVENNNFACGVTNKEIEFL